MATVEQESTAARAVTVSGSEVPQMVGRLGSWQLVRCLGTGAMTRVYLARPAGPQESRGVAYAIKVLRKEWWRDPQAIGMQRREAWIGRQVSHPNLAPVLSASVQEAPFFLVMPRLAGTTLATLLDQRRELPIPLALWIVRQVAEGLAALHEATGMMHADIKPANIFVAATGHATLLDFGFAHTPAEAAYWANRPVLGSLNYIAPEMVTSALAADARSDMYSLGVTLYETLTGRLPLESEDPAELATLHRQARPECVRELRADLPKPVASVVHTLLSKDPVRRPASYRELIERLVRLEIDCFSLRS